jgi:hypothetical protein
LPTLEKIEVREINLLLTTVLRPSLIDPVTRTTHPTGSSGINNLTFDSANRLNLQFAASAFQKDNVVLSGQMAKDEFWGYWSYRETWISLYGPGWVSIVSGRFSASRQN